MQASQHRCQYMYQVPVLILSSIFDLFVTQQHLFVTKSDTKTEILVFESASTKVKLLRPQYRANIVVLSNKLKKSFSRIICDTFICDTFICDKFWHQTEILVSESDNTKVKLLGPQYRDQQKWFRTTNKKVIFSNLL